MYFFLRPEKAYKQPKLYAFIAEKHCAHAEFTSFCDIKYFYDRWISLFSHTYSRIFMIKRNKNSNFECQNKEIVVTDGI